MTEKKRPRVGVGVVILKDKKVLLGKRKGEHGEGMWCPPGGHLEYSENVFDCAKRETLEEAGIQITNLRAGPYTNENTLPYEKHYVTLFVIADYKSGEPRVMELDKCAEWGWFEWDNLPKPLFYAMQNFVNEDILNELGEMSKKEHDYYENLK